MKSAISLRQMRYFVAVAQEQSFRLAAERLHLTQPPLSRQVSELEAALGVVLLQRDSRGVRLTAAGSVALKEFRTLLAQADAALERIAAQRDALPRLRLGLMNWLDMAQLAQLEQRLQRQGLVASVESRLMPSHEAVAALQGGKLDAAMVAAPMETQGLPSTVLTQLRLAAFVPQDSALARRRQVSLRDLNQVPPFYRFRRSISPLLFDHFDRQYQAHGFVPAQEVAAPEVFGVFARIAAGQGCTCMPTALAVRRYAGVARRTLRERVTMDVALVTRPDMDAALQAALVAAARALVPAAEQA